jgi:hypothetical protein
MIKRARRHWTTTPASVTRIHRRLDGVAAVTNRAGNVDERAAPGPAEGPRSSRPHPDEVLRRSATRAASDHASAPIFIVGSPRSGTTLVQSIISASPELAVAPENDFLMRFLDEFSRRDLRDRGTLDSFVTKLFALKATKYWKIERDTLLEHLQHTAPDSYPQLVRRTYEHFAHGEGARRWGAKVPYFALHLAVLAQMFPDVRVVHVVRDGRDVLASMRERTRHGATHFPVDARFAALRWKQLVLAGSRGAQLLGPQQYLELRYEDLITDPDAVVARLERFLGCTLPAAAEAHYRHAIASAVVHSDDIERYLRPGITPASMARWQRELGARDVQWFEAIAGEVLRAKGYSTGNPRVPVGLRVLGGLTASVYSLYRHVPRSLKPTVRQHVS